MLDLLLVVGVSVLLLVVVGVEVLSLLLLAKRGVLGLFWFFLGRSAWFLNKNGRSYLSNMKEELSFSRESMCWFFFKESISHKCHEWGFFIFCFLGLITFLVDLTVD
jgi:hypothetical protein